MMQIAFHILFLVFCFQLRIDVAICYCSYIIQIWFVMYHNFCSVSLCLMPNLPKTVVIGLEYLSNTR